MAPTRGWMEDLVMEIQGAFLDTPGLSLTASDARKRFGVPAATCDAVMLALTDAQVLEQTPEGTYIRHIPQPAVEAPRAQRQQGNRRRAFGRHAA